MSNSKSPRLPEGTSSTLNGIAETFLFHSSPEEFITSRIQAIQSRLSTLIASHTVFRAKILNRNVAILSSNAQIKHVLLNSSNGQKDSNNKPAYIATDAYKELMAEFFPRPNLLLSDGRVHLEMRGPWEGRIQNLSSRIKTLVYDLTREHFSEPSIIPIDIYQSLKTLSWRILLGLFLNLDASHPAFEEIEVLQEDLLRGQFSPFPVQVNLGFWRSPRKKGIDAKTKLLKVILSRLTSVESACPFFQLPKSQTPDLEEIANHILLFTSSLAVKAISSLLTAYLLNIFLFSCDDVRLYSELADLQGVEKEAVLWSVLLETERLSPPIVGIMRRATRDTTIPTVGKDEADIFIPAGWDVWLYFVGGGRDTATYGENRGRFVPGRFNHLSSLSSSNPSIGSTAFSTGAKTCLGRDLVRQVCVGVATTLLDMGVRLNGEVKARGVKGWLGWEENDNVTPEEWARDMKQLPTQHPAEPVMVRVAPG